MIGVLCLYVLLYCPATPIPHEPAPVQAIEHEGDGFWATYQQLKDGSVKGFLYRDYDDCQYDAGALADTGQWDGRCYELL